MPSGLRDRANSDSVSGQVHKFDVASPHKYIAVGEPALCPLPSPTCSVCKNRGLSLVFPAEASD